MREANPSLTEESFFSFRQIDRHTIDDRLFDKDTIAMVIHTPEESGRERMMECFGQKWAFQYTATRLMDDDTINLFPRGIVLVP